MRHWVSGEYREEGSFRAKEHIDLNEWVNAVESAELNVCSALHKNGPGEFLKESDRSFRRLLNMKGYLTHIILVLIAAIVFCSAARAQEQSIFTSQTPRGSYSDGSNTNYELGLRFTTNVAGKIVAIRFYKPWRDRGTHIGRLWDAAGNLLGSVTFSGETASGWQRQNLSTSINISANTEYMVTVNTAQTWYAATTGGLNAQLANGNLTTIVGSNGRYGPVGSYPTNSWQNSNYFRDIVFVPNGVGVSDTSPPSVPTNLTATATSSSQIDLNWTASTDNVGVTRYLVFRNNAQVGTPTANTYSDTGLAASTAYTYTVKAADAAGNVSNASSAATATTQSASSGGSGGSGGSTGGVSDTTVPTGRRTNWAYTGVSGGIPSRGTVCATFSPGATATAINNAISSCNNGVVYLNAGTYASATLNGTIKLYKSNVTLRGAGADKTILTGGQIISMGNGSNAQLGTAITGGATQGSTTFTVASTANLSVGTMIEVDRNDDPNLVVNTGNQGGGNRNITQVNMITAINGNTITVRNPFFYDFSTGSPKVKWYFVGITQRSGVEDLKLEHNGFSGGYNFYSNYCESCWLRGVESAHATGYHFIFLGTLNMEIRDSYIHEGASGPNNSGLNFYGNYNYGANSSAKIENNIFNKNFPAIELNGSSSGFYIGYNYSYGSPSQYGSNLVTWTFDDGHAPFNIMNLYEGNIGEMWGADNYFGGSGYGTALRNYWRGFNPNYNVSGDAVWLDRLGYYYNVVGNVLGSSNQVPTGYSGCGKNIYRLGYPNLGNCSTAAWDNFAPSGGYPDQKVTQTLMRWGNYDYFNNTTRFNATEVPNGVPVPKDQTIIKSYIYTTKPAWWPASIPWPPIGPDVNGGNGDTSGHVNKIPAQICWESSNLNGGGSFSAKTCFGGST